MTMFQIKNRFTGAVQFECELSAEVSAEHASIQLGFAIKTALKANINLSGAYLSGANLSGAYLRGANLGDANLRCANLRCANLSDANLSGANLRGANLSGAYLRDANLSGAYLSGANLRGANLGDANLRCANLRCANLSDANLSGANLRGANLSGANLRGANLRDANLSGAYLRGANLGDANLGDANLRDANLRDADLRGAYLGDANLQSFKQDLIAEVLRVPAEIDGLRQALIEGRIDGSTYSGECACLAGTVAKLRGDNDYNGETIQVSDKVAFRANSSSPREVWFMGIRKGDTAATNQMAAIALEWIDEAIAIRDNIRATEKVPA